MNSSLLRSAQLPPFITMIGALLMLFAWPLARMVPREHFLDAYSAAFVIWVVLLSHYAIFVLRCRLTPAVLIQAVAAMGLFIFTLFSNDHNRAHHILTHLFASAGLILFVGGALSWARIMPCFRKLGLWLRIHRRLPAPWFGIVAAELFLAMEVFLSWYCFGWLPAYPDSAAQYIHGKFIAAGHYFYIDSHPLRQFFPVWLMVNDGRWYSQYQPLHQTWIGIGHMIGMPWLVNPLCGALTLLALYRLVRREYNEATARISVLLMFCCQFIIFMSAEMMNHASALLFATLFLDCYLRMLRSLSDTPESAWKWGLAAGVAIGALFLTRPLCAVGVALVFMAHALILLARNLRRHLAAFGAMAGAGGAALLFQAWYNANTTGHFWMFPYSKYHVSSLGKAMGFHRDSNVIGTLRKGWNEWVSLNGAMFEWALPSLFFVLVVCLLPMKRTTRLLALTLLAYTAVNMANQFNSNIFGPRYLYEISSVILVLTALGIRRLPHLYALAGMRMPPRNAVVGVMATALILVIGVGLTERFPKNLKRYSSGYIDSRPQFHASLMEQAQKPAVIFIGRFAATDRPQKDETVVKYRSIAHANPPTDDAPVIFAIDLGDTRNRAMIDYYPGRHAYVEYKGKLIPADIAARGPLAKK